MLQTLRKWWPWVRFQRPMYQKPDRRWLWTPLTKRFGHGGWVFLNLRWLWRFRNGV